MDALPKQILKDARPLLAQGPLQMKRTVLAPILIRTWSAMTIPMIIDKEQETKNVDHTKKNGVILISG